MSPSTNAHRVPRRGLVLATALSLSILSACSTVETRRPAAEGARAPIGTEPSESRARAGEATPPSEAAHARYAEAVAAMQRVRFDVARAIFATLAESHPQMSGPHTNLGILAARVDDDAARALDHFRSAVAANPENATAHNWMGVLYRKQGDYAEAERHYRAALQASPDYALAHRNLALLYDLYLDRPPDAARHYEAYRRLAQGGDALMAEVWLRTLQTDPLKRPEVAAIGTGAQP
ncbi:tetratricopeptide repeat protein [Algiphilus sp.]|uniref:tetratricopeptide repeat protein n=1 Tax=Algiphilus sp. TaxID=1872431 RepID=UPI003B52709A